MSHLVVNTVKDLRCGRTTWRVALLLTVPALIAGMIVGLV
jgi:flagellar biosynthesis protein FliQ